MKIEGPVDWLGALGVFNCISDTTMVIIDLELFGFLIAMVAEVFSSNYTFQPLAIQHCLS